MTRFCADDAVWLVRAAKVAPPQGTCVDGAFRPTADTMPCTSLRDGSLPVGVAGHGRDKPRHAMDLYTERKPTWINLRRAGSGCGGTRRQ